jgi:Carboxypeptidase regulatory-like domain
MRSLTIALCLFLVAWTVLGQSDRGAITGTISDPGGGVVANAAIRARNVETGIVYTVATTGTGNYSLNCQPATMS